MGEAQRLTVAYSAAIAEVRHELRCAVDRSIPNDDGGTGGRSIAVESALMASRRRSRSQLEETCRAKRQCLNRELQERFPAFHVEAMTSDSASGAAALERGQ